MGNLLVTGANGNLGSAIVRHFLGNGWQVTGIIHPESTPPGEDIRVLKVDLMDEAAANNAVKETAKTMGSIDAAVLTVGGFSMGNLTNTGESELIEMIELNFFTAYHTARAVFQQMKKQEAGGRIFFIGAKPALEPQLAKAMVSYALSKSMLFKLAEIINETGKEDGIIAGVIVPSIIDTPQNRAAMPDADFSKWVKPENIAATLGFLCSEPGSDIRHPVIKIYGDA